MQVWKSISVWLDGVTGAPDHNSDPCYLKACRQKCNEINVFHKSSLPNYVFKVETLNCQFLSLNNWVIYTQNFRIDHVLELLSVNLIKLFEDKWIFWRQLIILI